MCEVFTVPLTERRLSTLRSGWTPYVDDDVEDGEDDDVPSMDMERFWELVRQLPEIDQDIIDLVMQGVKQAQIAEIMGCSQNNISHHLRRAQDRLRFIATKPRLTDDELRSLLEEVRHCGAPLPPLVIDLMIAYWHNGHMTQAAASVGWSQTRATRWVRITIERLSTMSAEHRRIGRTYEMIRDMWGWMFRSENTEQHREAIRRAFRTQA